jgi:hypothetical protein
MDITGKEEDAVSTALFDAAWDENRAIEILLEDGDQLSAWEESGSKKRKNKLKQAADDASKVTLSHQFLTLCFHYYYYSSYVRLSDNMVLQFLGQVRL